MKAEFRLLILGHLSVLLPRFPAGFLYLRRKDDLLIQDVRPAEEHAAGHVPASMSIPVAELKRRLKELPKNKEIVAYCRVCSAPSHPKPLATSTRRGTKPGS